MVGLLGETVDWGYPCSYCIESPHRPLYMLFFRFVTVAALKPFPAPHRDDKTSGVRPSKTFLISSHAAAADAEHLFIRPAVPAIYCIRNNGVLVSLKSGNNATRCRHNGTSRNTTGPPCSVIVEL